MDMRKRVQGRASRVFVLLLLCFCLISGFCVLEGCSGYTPISFSSVLNIRSDESGTRTMTVGANKKTLQKIFHNSNFSFQSFITANCPKLLEWDYEETAAEYEVTFVLYFDSLDDYQEKMAQLTNVEDFTSVSRPKVGVKTGFTLSEQDSLMSVFSWFTDALMQRTGLSSYEFSSYCLQQTNELIYNERNYESQNGKLICTAETILDASRIDILTAFSLEEWNREIYIIFPDELKDNASNVKTYLDEMIPDTITSSWSEDTTWKLSFSADSFDELCVLTSQIFQASSRSAAKETILAKDSMCIVHSYSEPFQFSFFVPESGSTRVRYFYRSDTQSEVAVYDEEHNTQSLPYERIGYSDYQCLFDSIVDKSYTYNYDVVFQYQPKQITVNSQVMSIQLLTRTFSLSFKEIPQLHRQLIYDTVNNDASGYGTVSSNVDASGQMTLVFTQTGTPSYLAKGFEAVFHGKEKLDYSCEATALFEPTHTYYFSEAFDFSGFLIDEAATRISISIQFPAATSIVSDMLTSNLSGTESISGNIYTAQNTSFDIQVSMSLSQGNPAYYLCIIALLVIVAAILYYVYGYFVHKQELQVKRRNFANKTNRPANKKK